MQTVTVEVKRLQATLKENLETHKREFREAMIGFELARKEAIAEVANVAGRCDHTSEGRKLFREAFNAFNTLDHPRNYSKSYEQAIDLMEWETRDEIELSVADFEKYVRDNWTWSGSFKKSLANYSPHTHSL